jgi:hypothetical protein
MVRYISFAFGAVVGLMGSEAGAEKWSRDVEVKWSPQKKNDPNERSWVAYIPNGFINRFEQNDNVGRFLGVTYDDGTYCSTVGLKNEIITLSCGSHRGHYDVTAESQHFKLTWVTKDPSVGVGDK